MYELRKKKERKGGEEERGGVAGDGKLKKKERKWGRRRLNVRFLVFYCFLFYSEIYFVIFF